MKVRYTCKHCNGLNSIESFKKWFFTPHLGAKKYLMCGWCGMKSFMARTDGRKWLDWPKEKNND
jgi:hypothetical protein